MAEFNPKLVGFLCNWCSYAGADLAGVSRIQYPPNLRIIRVMCSGRVDPVIVLQSLIDGIDGVLVLGCHPGDCHYTTGNLFAEKKMKLISNLLVKAGIHHDRLRLDWVSAAEGERFANIVTDFTQRIQSLGPIGEAERLGFVADAKNNKEEFNDRLSAVQGALSGEKLRWLVGSELKLVEEGNVYGEKVEEREILSVLKENMDEEYTRNRILLMLKESPLSVKDVASKLQICPADILGHVVALENAGMVSLADVQGRSPRYIASE
jgi:coenzyme F420-reducing hydrogenase delta subunit/DNA-binding transcriptional ArsR family regulator